MTHGERMSRKYIEWYKRGNKFTNRQIMYAGVAFMVILALSALAGK